MVLPLRTRSIGNLARAGIACPRGMFGLGLLAALAGAAYGGQAPSATGAVGAAPILVGFRAAHRSGFDRIVFEFAGTVPARRQVRYVNRLIADPSGRIVPIAGRAILQVSFYRAAAHNSGGRPTATASTAFALPNVLAVVRSGDFESVVSYGIGLAKRTPVHVLTLTRPSRVVIDIGTSFRTVLKGVYFFNQRRFAANTQPFVTRVLRPVVPATPATALLDRLFAGPTSSEYAGGLRLLESKASGFRWVCHQRRSSADQTDRRLFQRRIDGEHQR